MMVMLGVLFMLMLFGILQSSNAAAAGSPVKLHSAEINYFTERGAVVGYNVQGYVTVEEDQTVGFMTINYAYDYSNWQDVKAKFIGRTDGKQLWYFETDKKEVYPYKYFNYKCELAVKYEADNQISWDNNHGQNYFLQHKSVGSEYIDRPYILAGTKVKAVNISDYYKNKEKEDIYLRGKIVLENLAYDKEVEVIYSCDNWQTRQRVEARYVSGYENNLEEWSFKLPNIKAGATVNYIVLYRANGETYWDSSFAKSYEHQVDLD